MLLSIYGLAVSFYFRNAYIKDPSFFGGKSNLRDTTYSRSAYSLGRELPTLSNYSTTRR